MENWSSAFDTIKTDQPYFESYFTPLDYKIVMVRYCGIYTGFATLILSQVSLQDIGNICAQHILATAQHLSISPYVFDLHGPRSYSANDIRTALEEITGKKINIVAIESEQLLGLYSSKVPAPQDQELVDMTVAMLPGGILATQMEKQDDVVRGTSELADVLHRLLQVSPHVSK